MTGRWGNKTFQVQYFTPSCYGYQLPVAILVAVRVTCHGTSISPKTARNAGRGSCSMKTVVRNVWANNKLCTLVGMLSVMVFSILILVGCDSNGNQSELCGKWVVYMSSDDGGQSFHFRNSAPYGIPDEMELFKDGTGVCDKKTVSWKTEKQRLVILSSSYGATFDYKLIRNIKEEEGTKMIKLAVPILLLVGDRYHVQYIKR